MPESSNEKPVSHHHVGVYVTFSRGYPRGGSCQSPNADEHFATDYYAIFE